MSILQNLPLALPVIGAPMFTISGPELVIAQCKAGVIGSFPALNARPAEVLDEWLIRIRGELARHDAANPATPAAPFAVNLIVHKSNVRLEHDLSLCVKHRVPIVITSLGARPEVNDAVRAYGGIVLHDVIHVTHARKAVERNADGLIAVAGGAGGHAGTLSPFALVQEIRQWWRGPLVLSGAIATGAAVLAAQVMGADFGYVGSAFIATHESNAPPEYKAMIVSSHAEDVVYTSFFSGVHGNYLKPSIVRAGLDPDNLPASERSMSFAEGSSRPKAWRDIWGCGQGIGAVSKIVTAGELVARLAHEYRAAQRRHFAPLSHSVA